MKKINFKKMFGSLSLISVPLATTASLISCSNISQNVDYQYKETLANHFEKGDFQYQLEKQIKGYLLFNLKPTHPTITSNIPGRPTRGGAETTEFNKIFNDVHSYGAWYNTDHLLRVGDTLTFHRRVHNKQQTTKIKIVNVEWLNGSQQNPMFNHSTVDLVNISIDGGEWVPKEVKLEQIDANLMPVRIRIGNDSQNVTNDVKQWMHVKMDGSSIVEPIVDGVFTNKNAYRNFLQYVFNNFKMIILMNEKSSLQLQILVSLWNGKRILNYEIT